VPLALVLITLMALAAPATSAAAARKQMVDAATTRVPSALLHRPARRLVWSDEFDLPVNSPPNPANWSFDRGSGWGNGRELQCYTGRRRNARHDGLGRLRIVARRERHRCAGGTGSRYTSARIRSAGKREFQYGLVEARMKVPPGQGIWSAFWTLGSDAEPLSWPREGEIDILEVIGREPTIAQRSLHGPTRSGGHWRITRDKGGTAWHRDFHVYAVRWSENRIDFLIDGVTHGTITVSDLRPTWLWPLDEALSPLMDVTANGALSGPTSAVWPFNKPHFLLLNVAVGGPDSWPGAPDASTPFPATLLVDWLRVYR
jgi:beta-glucanase (GH16 family)